MTKHFIIQQDNNFAYFCMKSMQKSGRLDWFGCHAPQGNQVEKNTHKKM